MKKSRTILFVLTLLIWAGMYYYYLPALNIHSEESWMFFVAAVLVGLVLVALKLLVENGLKQKVLWTNMKVNWTLFMN